MAKININGQSYDVHEEVAATFAQYMSKCKRQQRMIDKAVEAVHNSEFEDIGYNVLCALDQNP